MTWNSFNTNRQTFLLKMENLQNILYFYLHIFYASQTNVLSHFAHDIWTVNKKFDASGPLQKTRKIIAQICYTRQRCKMSGFYRSVLKLAQTEMFFAQSTRNVRKKSKTCKPNGNAESCYGTNNIRIFASKTPRSQKKRNFRSFLFPKVS